ncbi:MAG: hypothetical protein GY821_12620 [Gammaproteobacteria bacterium]|nr:hypothetical protein [Gammaproteobacteria bacterium]
MFLTKEQIKKADDLETKEVEAWGGKVLVKALTGAEREELRKETVNKEGEEDLLAIIINLVSLTVVDENKNRIFNKEDIEDLEKKSAKELDKVFKVAQELSGLGAGVTEEIEKNS